MPTHHTAPSYSARAFKLSEMASIIERAEPLIRSHNINTLVGIGTSGLPLIGAMSLYTDIPFVAIRKPNDNSHDETPAVGWLDVPDQVRWCFVDDLIDSGRTLKRVAEALRETNISYNPPSLILLYTAPLGPRRAPHGVNQAFGYGHNIPVYGI